MVIDKVKMSTNEVGGRVLDLSGAQYMIRCLGYLRSLDDLATVAVGSKNGTPILVRDLGTVNFGPDIREGVAEWNGEGETVGGIIVMRQGMNALNVINGVKQKLREIAPSLPPGVQIMTGYDRSDLIDASIKTLQRDLLEEAIIVSLVIIVFLFHFRSALIAIPRASVDSYQRSQTGWPGSLLFPTHHRCFLPARLPARSAGRTYVPPSGVDQDPSSRLFFHPCHHARASPDGFADSRPTATGACKSTLADPSQKRQTAPVAARKEQSESVKPVAECHPHLAPAPSCPAVS
jgi:AcrB/AcrD/AcrF family